VIDRIIDHKIFKPVALSIVTVFVLFNGIAMLKSYIADREEYLLQKRATTPIKITITEGGKAIDFNELQVSEYRVKSGDTMLKLLTRIGANEADVFAILTAMKKVFNPQGISVGDSVVVKYKLQIEAEPKESSAKKITISEVRVMPSPGLEIIITRGANQEYSAREIKQEMSRHIVRYSGVIKDGLYVDGVNAGISPTSMMNMIGLYAYEIDFQRDLHDGDKFEMLIESFYNENGRKIKDGDVLYSSLSLHDKRVETYAHRVDSHLEYFDGNGNSVRKSLLRTPVNGARISSGFGFRRHPILGYSKLHKGIDFAAPMGTPIFAAGNGTITFMGVHGGYGNFVRIKHNADYETQYGHASKFSKKFHVGSKVKQGDVVAYVGSTGRSTGPHLHFEIVYKGSAINPAKVKAVSGIRLAGKELARFQATKAEIDGYRKKIPNEITREN
jgi:murein DD-endopeptidase MepM/ murein hydrolase activator NlpD